MTAILGAILGSSVICEVTHFAEYPGGLIGYVGPGAGLSMLGALFAVVCVIVIALLGPVLYPIFAIRSWLRRRRERGVPSPTGCGGGEDAPGTVAARPDSDCREPGETCSTASPPASPSASL